jgi:hypothetical protein
MAPLDGAEAAAALAVHLTASARARWMQVSGQLPVMCKGEGASRLSDVFIRGTRLNGSLETAFYNCSLRAHFTVPAGVTMLLMLPPVLCRFAGLHKGQLLSAHQTSSTRVIGCRCAPQDNAFSGSVPTSPQWRQLHVLRLANNNLTGGRWQAAGSRAVLC